MGNIKMDLKEMMEVKFDWLRIETSSETCENGNEIRDPTRRGGGGAG
jgi:hypothetical protein